MLAVPSRENFYKGLNANDDDLKVVVEGI